MNSKRSVHGANSNFSKCYQLSIVSGWKGRVLVSAESLNWRLNRIKQADLALVLNLLLTAMQISMQNTCL